MCARMWGKCIQIKSNCMYVRVHTLSIISTQENSQTDNGVRPVRISKSISSYYIVYIVLVHIYSLNSRATATPPITSELRQPPPPPPRAKIWCGVKYNWLIQQRHAPKQCQNNFILFELGNIHLTGRGGGAMVFCEKKFCWQIWLKKKFCLWNGQIFFSVSNLHLLNILILQKEN